VEEGRNESERRIVNNGYMREREFDREGHKDRDRG
jgi:hypothetical protein